MSDVRCFVAFDVSAEARSLFAEAKREIVRRDPTWRDEKWVAPANLHVTLKFLGSVSETTIGLLADSIAESIVGMRSFEAPLVGVRAVRSLRRCSMVWGVFGDPNGETARLAAEIDGLASAFGVEPADRDFVSHVTLVRARRPKRLDAEAFERANALVTASNAIVSVRAVTLFSSTLTKHGPVYETLAQLPLGERG